MFLNNLLRCQNISDNPAQTDPLHEYNPVAGCVPTRTIKLYKHWSLQDLISLLCMWIEPDFCHRDDEGRIFSFASKACQLGDQDKEKCMKYTKLKSFEEGNTKKAELKIIRKITESEQRAVDIDSVARFGHCAETYAINYFANLFLTKPGPQETAWLPLCGFAIRLDSIKAVKFSFESIL